MEPATMRTSKKRWNFARVAMALVIAALTGGLLTVPASADDHGRDRGHHGDRHDDHRDRGDYRLHNYGSPGYVYAPPPVYYAPPPGPPVIDFVIPLHFR